MKKIIAVFAAALLGFSAYAQVGITVGGAMGFTFSSLSTKMSASDGSRMKEKISSGVSFKILPEVGYQFNDKLSFGASLGYMHGYAALGAFDLSDFKGLANLAVGTASDLYLNGNQPDGDPMSQVKIGGLRFAPYARFTFLHTKWVDLFAEGNLGYNLALVRIKDDGAWTNNKIHIFEMMARPGIALNLGEKFQIMAKFGSLGLQVGSMVEKEVDEGVTIKESYTVTRFGFDIDSGSLLFGLGYRF